MSLVPPSRAHVSGWRAAVRARVGRLTVDVDIGGDARPVALIGPNGSGKTTLLRVLAGAVDPLEAEIEVGGRVLFSSSRGVNLPMERRRVGYVPQGYGLFPHLSTLENVAFGLSTGPARQGRAKRRARARALLDRLGAGHLEGRPVAGLSGGERQRVSLARAMVIDPHFLLLDEPMAALDASTRRTVRRFLAHRLTSFGRPSIIVTHDVRDVAAFAALVHVLEGGQVIQSGSLEALRARPQSDFIADFVALDQDMHSPSGDET